MIITVPQTAQTLQSIISKANPYGKVLYLQAARANTEDVFFGPKNEVDLFLGPGLSASYPAPSLSSIYVRAVGAGQQLVVVFNKS